MAADPPDWLGPAKWCEAANQPPTDGQSSRIMPDGQAKGARISRDLFQQAVAAAAKKDCAMATAWMIECQSDNAEAATAFRDNSAPLCRWLVER